MLLKRSTPQNIVLGGAAGALPPVIGWAAVTGDITLPALLLFAIVFYWTPPHFWALSLRIRGDYEAAGVPMLPVTHGVPETTRQIALYSVLMVALTLVFFAVAHMGLVFLAGTLVLGGAVPVPGLRHVARRDRPPRGAPVQVLDHVPVGAVRAHRAGRGVLRADGEARPGRGAARAIRRRASAALVRGSSRSWRSPAGRSWPAAHVEQQVGIVTPSTRRPSGGSTASSCSPPDGRIVTFDTTELRFQGGLPGGAPLRAPGPRDPSW